MLERSQIRAARTPSPAGTIASAVWKPGYSGRATVGAQSLGWGSPDGTKLLEWLREHPTPQDGNKMATAACLPNAR